MKRFAYALSLEAQRDLAEIYLYFSDLGDAPAGRKLVRSLQLKIRKLASGGNAGVARDWVFPGLRAFPFKNRCIYFRIVDQTLFVLRIVHGRQELTQEMLVL